MAKRFTLLTIICICCSASALESLQIPVDSYLQNLNAVALCEGIMSLLANPPPRTSDPDVEVVTLEQFNSFKGQDFVDRIGRRVIYDHPMWSRLPQTLLRVKELPEDTQRIARALFRRSKQSQFRDRNLTERKAAFGAEVLKYHPGLQEGRSEAELNAYLDECLGFDKVEIGIWRIQLKTGEVYIAPHTSRTHDELNPKDMIGSLNGILKAKKLTADQIVSIDFFHNHPPTIAAGLIVSRGDENVSSALRSSLNHAGGRHITHSFNAIYRSGSGAFFISRITPP